MLHRAITRLPVRATLILASSFLLAGTVRSQTPGEAAPLPVGTRVRLHTGPSSVIQGDLLQMTADSIAFREHLSRSRLALSIRQVPLLERSVGHPGIVRGAVNMAIIGGAIGALVGYQLSGVNSCTDAVCRPSRVGATLGVGALFAAVGALTVGVLTPERWETVFDRRTH